MAYNLTSYNINNGFHAWHELYNRYVPLAEDLQNICLQELISLKLASENEIDVLFNEVERITDRYVKVGPADKLSEKWNRAAVLCNVPEKVTIALAMDLKKADPVDEIQGIINVHLHDHRTGLPRGTPGHMIAMVEAEKAETADNNGQQKAPIQQLPEHIEQIGNSTTNALPNKKGGKKVRFKSR